MDRKFMLTLSLLSFLASGFYYKIEKMTSYVYWIGQVLTGEYPTKPEFTPLYSNWFFILSFLLGVVFFVLFLNQKKLELK